MALDETNASVSARRLGFSFRSRPHRMFDSNSNYRSKREVVATVRLTSGDLFVGSVFLKIDERLIDLMNDARAFIPIKRDDGGAIIVAKTSIESLREGAFPDGEDVVKQDSPAAGAAADDADRVAEDAASPGPDEVAKESQERDRFAREEADDTVATDGGQTASDRLAAAYRALRASPDATDAEVKAAYKARMKAVHPDAQFGAGPEREKAALHATQLVNRAYQAV